METTFHENLNRLRDESGLSATQVAGSLGIHLNTYIRWEDGPGEPRVTHLRQLADLFGVSYDELLPPPSGKVQRRKRRKRVSK